MGILNKRIKYITPQEMNEVLAESQHKIKYFVDYDYAKEQTFINSLTSYSIYVVDKPLKLCVTTCYKGENTTFICFKDGRELIDEESGAHIFAVFSQYWPVPRTSPKDISASPLLGYNPEYEGQRIEAWGYDLNSAYSAAMLNGWIDTSEPPRVKKIDEETEVGFTFDDEGFLVLQHSGFCDMVFKKMETPKGVRDYVIKWYRLKKTAKSKEEKVRAKRYLNYIVGFFQRVNPWLRAWIVCSCNEFIENLLDENSLFWNTDSIVSRVRRTDLEADCGSGLGQWKIEHKGVVAYRGLAYQWNQDKPTYRGVVKSWFPDDYDILKDPLPECGNAYEFNKDKFILEETKWHDNSINI